MSATERSGAVGSGPQPAGKRSTRGGPKRDRDSVLRHLADFLDAFMWQADPSTLRLTYLTDGVEDLLGVPSMHLLARPDGWDSIVDAEDRDRVIECLRATAADGRDREIEFRARTTDGRTLTLRHAIRLITDESGRPELWGLTTDVTADRRAEERYRRLSTQAAEFKRRALHDALTGLPNRVLLDDRLRAALETARRAGSSCTVLLMDLDGFKEINDTRGHRAGDDVLRDVALRFRIALRAQDTSSRLGGDEFAAVLPNTDRAGAIRAADRILRALGSCEVGASIGIALFPDHGAEADELLGRADVAMYRAKQSGGGFALFTDEGERALAPTVRRRWPAHPAARRRLMRALLTVAAAVGLASGAFAPVAHVGPSAEDAASRLAAAVAALEDAPAQEVGDAVGVVEDSIAGISWQEVGEPDVVAVLDRLEHVLDDLAPDVRAPIGNRVETLIATIHQAEVVAKVPDPPGDGVQVLEEPSPSTVDPAAESPASSPGSSPPQ